MSRNSFDDNNVWGIRGDEISPPEIYSQRVGRISKFQIKFVLKIIHKAPRASASAGMSGMYNKRYIETRVPFIKGES